ncbi:MAG: hypothetical protein ACHQDE_01095 [Acidimicrobiia bacterium]
MRIFDNRAGRLVGAAVCSGALVALSVGAIQVASGQERSSNPCAPTANDENVPGAGATPADAPGGSDTNQDPCGGPPGNKTTTPTFVATPTTTTTPQVVDGVIPIKVSPKFTG